MYKQLIRPFLFSLDPEFAHDMTMWLLEQLAPFATHLQPPHNPTLVREVFGVQFPNPVCLAAGLDKHGKAMPMLAALGFGGLEIGSVTAHPQRGNARPRMFRLPADRALINRFGFNGDGAEEVARRFRRDYPILRQMGVPVGVSIGKNLDVDATDIAAVVANYGTVVDALMSKEPHPDYLVVNVSSPNTKGLRDLQIAESAKALCSATRERIERYGNVPLLVKVSPDMPSDDCLEMLRVLEGIIAGVILSNTTTKRDPDLESPNRRELGGLSGAPLYNRMIRRVQLVRNEFPKLPIIASGGISKPQHVETALLSGASLVQILTGLVYEGPFLPRTLNAAYLQMLAE